MTRYRFADFVLDPADRRLSRAGATVELNARYLDVLILLVEARGGLVTKDRFMAEVWKGVPVTDEALTQGVRTLRRALGDDAGRPRFIETAPKHGYRFIAPVETDEATTLSAPAPASIALIPVGPARPDRRPLVLALAGALGGAVAGLAGGVFYGAIVSSQGVGGLSTVLVLTAVTLLVGVLGGAGVGLGLSLLGLQQGRVTPLSIVGGGVGGAIVGGVTKLIGVDAFTLFLGASPGDVTGAPEGLLLGAAIGLGAWVAGLGGGPVRLRRAAAAAGVCGAIAGVLIHLTGGRLMAGTLLLFAERFPASRLAMPGLDGPWTLGLVAALEGMLFGACVVAALVAAGRRRLRLEPEPGAD